MKDLISQHYRHGLLKYSEIIGVSINNLYAVLSGKRQCTLKFINKVLSGIQHECKCYQEFVIQPFETGLIAENAYYGELDDELLSEGIAALEQESISSSSEKPPEKPKTLQESLLQARQEESSTKPSNE